MATAGNDLTSLHSYSHVTWCINSPTHSIPRLITLVSLASTFSTTACVIRLLCNKGLGAGGIELPAYSLALNRRDEYETPSFKSSIDCKELR